MLLIFTIFANAKPEKRHFGLKISQTSQFQMAITFFLFNFTGKGLRHCS